MRQTKLDNYYYTIPLEKSSSNLSFQIENLEVDICYLLCWIDSSFSVKNDNAIFKVFFKKIEYFSENGDAICVSNDDFVVSTLSIFPLQHLYIGTIVLNNNIVSRIELPQDRFYIESNYNEASLSTLEASIKLNAPLLPSKETVTTGTKDTFLSNLITRFVPSSKLTYKDLLVFETSTENKVFIPKVKYFLALFGVSYELKRTLLTSSFEEAINAFGLADKSHDSTDSQNWHIPYFNSTKYHLRDAVFLAHLKYTKETKRAVKKLISSSVSNKIIRKKYLTNNLKICPWHDQSIELVVSGFPINKNNDFFVTHIQAFSEPGGAEISVHKDKRETTAERGAIVDDTENPIKRRTKLNSDIPIINASSTDSSVTNTDIPLHLQIIGNKREIEIAILPRYCANISTPRLFGAEPSAYSDAPVSSSKSGIGGIAPSTMQQNSKDDDEIELRSYIQEALEASNKLLEEGSFTSVEFFDGKEFKNSGDFGVFEVNTNKTQKKRVGFKKQLTFKGHALLLKLQTKTDTFLCMELQGIYSTQKYNGLLVKTTNVTNEKALIETLIESVILNNGVFKKVVSKSITSERKIYKHTEGATERWFKEFCLNLRIK